MLKKDKVIEIVGNAIGVEKKEAEGFLKEVDAVMEALANTLPVEEKANLGHFLTVEKKHVDAKNGVSKMGGVETPWTTKAKDVLKIKISKKLDK